MVFVGGGITIWGLNCEKALLWGLFGWENPPYDLWTLLFIHWNIQLEWGVHSL